jgi:hypothetical protein
MEISSYESSFPRRIVKKLCIFFIFLLVLLAESSPASQEHEEILKIREQFKSWQKVLNKETISRGKHFFEISLGRYSHEIKWVTKFDEKDENSDNFIYSQVTLIKDDKLGTMFYISETSPSGDWEDVAEHYYWPTGELFFVYWKLNTFVSLDSQKCEEQPLTIERRLYFNRDGRVIKFAESIYKMNTKEKVVNHNYMPHDVNYWRVIRALPFYNLLMEKD